MRILELCSGAGGQALGLERAGFEHKGLIEIEKDACDTLTLNRPNWPVYNQDLNNVDFREFKGVDLICGGVPCQPFSIAGHQLGHKDERDLFPIAVKAVEKLKPQAFFFENVRGLASANFDRYRNFILKELISLGYYVEFKVIDSSNYGVPQLRPRFILVGRRDGNVNFPWPKPQGKIKTVSQTIYDLMNENSWKQIDQWKIVADKIAPTVVGGSKKHGGPDLGPTRAKRQWSEMGVDGNGIANLPPESDFIGLPKLTNRMVARIQGFPDSWKFSGKKTSTYRQIGNAFPPPVAEKVGKSIVQWLNEKPVKKSNNFSSAFQQEFFEDLVAL
ncbi:DNA cytosine methyltransferase [Leptospira haakeii]|uniref:Cytosine-specific methyltransferase n=1 Tax=Leptospira haakeii TaxID=2023198 RepID=A0ABX4PEX0_9LEPT|nr:DNA cytosine methyltransferase [Leptospira haakeii]PKA14322.1 DNA (cytosine-5-)-methyltransferase [Leptospira haakeii]PKA18180.1 DNA (cytosine-5-)-methyltransferase [Leptospira haakeii]